MVIWKKQLGVEFFFNFVNKVNLIRDIQMPTSKQYAIQREL